MIVGILAFDWNPILLILYFMIDTAVMAFYGIPLYFKLFKDLTERIACMVIVPVVILTLPFLYLSLEVLIKALKLEDIYNTDPSQIINPILLPTLLSCSALAHYAEYLEALNRIGNNSFKAGYFKHFFLRYFLIYAFLLFIIFFSIFIDISLIVGILGIKTILRMYHRKFKEILWIVGMALFRSSNTSSSLNGLDFLGNKSKRRVL